MVKIKAFFISLCILLAIGCTAGYLHGSTPVKSDGIGLWIHPYKNLSYSTIAANVDADTALLLGSSEFQHGKRKPWHPVQVFGRSKQDVMIVGAAYNQSISHAILTGSLADQLQGHRVVLILSPAWFNSTGIRPAAFDVRFSETEYIRMLQSKTLSRELKKKIAERTMELLAEDKDLQGNVSRYNKKYLDGSLSIVDALYTNARAKWLSVRETANTSLAWHMYGKEKYQQAKAHYDGRSPAYADLLAEADRTYPAISSGNPYGMTDRLYKKNFRGIEKKAKNTQTDRQFPSDAPEYADLDLFLQVCKEAGTQVDLILLPMNGKWYDHVGFGREARAVLPDAIRRITVRYDNVRLDSFFDQEYTTGFLEDAVHPAGRGWISVDRTVSRFLEEDGE